MEFWHIRHPIPPLQKILDPRVHGLLIENKRTWVQFLCKNPFARENIKWPTAANWIIVGYIVVVNRCLWYWTSLSYQKDTWNRHIQTYSHQRKCQMPLSNAWQRIQKCYLYAKSTSQCARKLRTSYTLKVATKWSDWLHLILVTWHKFMILGGPDPYFSEGVGVPDYILFITSCFAVSSTQSSIAENWLKLQHCSFGGNTSNFVAKTFF